MYALLADYSPAFMRSKDNNGEPDHPVPWVSPMGINGFSGRHFLRLIKTFFYVKFILNTTIKNTTQWV